MLESVDVTAELVPYERNRSQYVKWGIRKHIRNRHHQICREALVLLPIRVLRNSLSDFGEGVEGLRRMSGGKSRVYPCSFQPANLIFIRSHSTSQDTVNVGAGRRGTENILHNPQRQGQSR